MKPDVRAREHQVPGPIQPRLDGRTNMRIQTQLKAGGMNLNMSYRWWSNRAMPDNAYPILRRPLPLCGIS
jgi:hypothetical protein